MLHHLVKAEVRKLAWITGIVSILEDLIFWYSVGLQSKVDGTILEKRVLTALSNYVSNLKSVLVNTLVWKVRTTTHITSYRCCILVVFKSGNCGVVEVWSKLIPYASPAAGRPLLCPVVLLFCKHANYDALAPKVKSQNCSQKGSIEEKGQWGNNRPSTGLVSAAKQTHCRCRLSSLDAMERKMAKVTCDMILSLSPGDFHTWRSHRRGRGIKKCINFEDKQYVQGFRVKEG